MPASSSKLLTNSHCGSNCIGKSNSAPAVFHELSDQIPMLCDLFEDYRTLKAKNVMPVFDRCRQVIESLDSLVSSVLPDTDGTIGVKVQKYIKDVNMQNKVVECKAELDSYKSTLARIAVLLGLGGRGKTSLALWYCRREILCENCY
ncbi:hypothetical protein F4782DRAFT_41694 [Xylaria castorea]|nr:hypothetical protein F4782DRAFT_41694 [Xylaria castorea]